MVLRAKHCSTPSKGKGLHNTHEETPNVSPHLCMLGNLVGGRFTSFKHGEVRKIHNASISEANLEEATEHWLTDKQGLGITL